MATAEQPATVDEQGHTSAPVKMRVLFVCLGNSCRSVMAEAIARQQAADVMVPSSAGVIPLGFVAPSTVQVLEERGVDCSGLRSKPLTRAIQQSAELIVNMTGALAGHWLPSEKCAEDWPVGDPYGGPPAAYRDCCDEVELRVSELAARRRAQNSRVSPGASHPAVSLSIQARRGQRRVRVARKN
jgi:arsenate reductase (thioredoxin)